MSNKVASEPFNDWVPDNPQERPNIAHWIVGFVEGEGTFSVSIYRNKATKIGWQIFPEFVVVQGESNKEALELIRDFFGCGFIYRGKKPKSTHKEDVYRFCVRSLRDLTETVVPFFRNYELRTQKLREFQKFVQIVDKMRQGKHLDVKGLQEIAFIVQQMNRKVPSKFLASSETVRQDSV